jgi:hypothetical protein
MPKSGTSKLAITYQGANNMRTWICSLMTLVCFSFATPAFAKDPACRDTQLGETMDEIKTEFRAFVNAYKAGNSDTQSKAIAKLVMLSKQAEGEKPLKAETVSAAQGQKMTDGFQRDMVKLTELFTEMQGFVAAGDRGEIAFMLDDIQQHNRSSHREYRLKCDD